MGKEDIFGFQVTVDHLVLFQEDETAEELLGETSYEFQRKAAEVMTLDKLVEVHAK